jgi:hypothetical protein
MPKNIMKVMFGAGTDLSGVEGICSTKATHGLQEMPNQDHL